jgi:hypothetical protein
MGADVIDCKFVQPAITAELYDEIKATPVPELTKRFKQEAWIDLKRGLRNLLWMLLLVVAIFVGVGLVEEYLLPKLNDRIFPAIMLILIVNFFHYLKAWNTLRCAHKERLGWYLRKKAVFEKTSDYEDFMARSGYGAMARAAENGELERVIKEGLENYKSPFHS